MPFLGESSSEEYHVVNCWFPGWYTDTVLKFSTEMDIFIEQTKNVFFYIFQWIVLFNAALRKQIWCKFGRDNSNTNVLKNDIDLIDAKTPRLQHSSNPLIAYLNINSLQNKTDALREIAKYLSLDIFCTDERKLDDSFPDHHFKIDGYQFPPFWSNRNKFEGGKIVYVEDDSIVKR